MKNKGYIVVLHEDFGLYIVQKNDDLNICKTDKDAVNLYVRDGGDIIINASEMLGMGIVNNEHNRKTLLEATYGVEVIELNGMNKYFYIKCLTRGNKYTKTMDTNAAKSLKYCELYNYIKQVIKRHAQFSDSFIVLGFIKKV